MEMTGAPMAACAGAEAFVGGGGGGVGGPRKRPEGSTAGGAARSGTAADPHPGVSAAVERVFEFLRAPERAWARDFVLDSSPGAMASMLRNDEALRYSISAAYAESCFEVPGGGANGAYDRTVTFEVLFVPAISIGSVAAGCVVDRLTHGCADAYAAGRGLAVPPPSFPVEPDDESCGSHPPSAGRCLRPALPSQEKDYWHRTPHVFEVGRFVRDELTGELLIVTRFASHAGVARAHSASVPLLCICHHVHRSTCHRDRVELVCDEQLFLKGRLVESVCSVLTAAESRHCPICRAAPNTGCGCAYAFQQPTSSHDFSAGHPSMLTQVGEFLGSSRVWCSRPVANACVTRAAAASFERAARSGLIAAAATAAAMAAMEAVDEDPTCGNDTEGAFIQSPLMMSRIQICGYGENAPGVRGSRHRIIREVLQDFAIKLSLVETNPTTMVVPAASLARPKRVYYPSVVLSQSARSGPGLPQRPSGDVLSAVRRCQVPDAANEDEMEAASTVRGGVPLLMDVDDTDASKTTSELDFGSVASVPLTNEPDVRPALGFGKVQDLPMSPLCASHGAHQALSTALSLDRAAEDPLGHDLGGLPLPDDIHGLSSFGTPSWYHASSG